MPNTEPHTPSFPSPAANDPQTTHNTHPFGAGPNPMFVPAGFVFPDVSKSAGAAQPVGAVQGAPVIEGALGGYATLDHTKQGGV